MKGDPSRLARAARLLLPAVLLAAAGWTIHAELRGFRFHDLRASGAALPRGALGAAAAIAAVDYLLLSAYDVLGLRYAGRALPYPRVLFTSFVSYAFGNNVGFALLSSSSVRYRLYSQWGLSGVEIGKVVGFTAITLWVGLLPLGGAALLAGAPVPLAPWAARGIGAAALAVTAAWLAYWITARRPRRALPDAQ